MFKQEKLTQSQTQIQNQIERLSDHYRDKGAMIILNGVNGFMI